MYFKDYSLYCGADGTLLCDVEVIVLQHKISGDLVEFPYAPAAEYFGILEVPADSIERMEKIQAGKSQQGEAVESNVEMLPQKEAGKPQQGEAVETNVENLTMLPQQEDAAKNANQPPPKSEEYGINKKLDIWTDGETKLLLDLYRKNFGEVGPLKKFKTKKNMWEFICKKIGNDGRCFTPRQVQNRFKIVLKHKTKAIKNNRTSGATRINMLYEKELENLVEVDDSILPEVIMSAGVRERKQQPLKRDISPLPSTSTSNAHLFEPLSSDSSTVLPLGSKDTSHEAINSKPRPSATPLVPLSSRRTPRLSPREKLLKEFLDRKENFQREMNLEKRRRHDEAMAKLDALNETFLGVKQTLEAISKKLGN